jgi:uncharacterized protein YuzE
MPVVSSKLLIPFIVGEGEEEKSSLISAEYKKEEKTVLGTVANVRYYHQAAAWDSPLSFGVQAFIEYNGLVLNDRYQSDLIRVTEISGLDDAEVRDNREARPSKSGEFAYDAFYGGRNLVLNGFIEAGSLAACETLKKNLKAAFAPLEESYLKFRWFDIYDPFDDPNTILEYNPNAKLSGIPSGNYSPFIGSLSNLKVENGLLSWKTVSKVYFIRTSEKRTFCDSQVTLKCIVGAYDTSYIGLIPCAKNSENYVILKYEENTEAPKLTIAVIDSGTEYILKSESVPAEFIPFIGESIWIKGKKEGNILTFELWGSKPSTETYPNFSISATLTGSDEENYGDGILSEVGIAGNQVNTSWSFDEFRVESSYPGDIQFKARKLSPISIKDVQTSLTKFKRPFQIALKASDFRAFSSAQIVKTIAPSDITSTPSLGRAYPREYPLSYRYYTSTELPLESNLISVNNRGSVFVEPILYLYGPGEDIILENLTNGQTLEWFGSISEGDYLKFDCKEETLENSLGANFLEDLVPTTEWMKLEPMWNDIYVSGSKFGSTTKLVIKYRYGYM